ncbi:DUF1254 domain-containing protein [Rhodococcus erythropolis]
MADAVEEHAYALGIQAMLWGYPLTCYAVTNEASVRVGAARVNDFRRFETLKTAADRYVVTPNNLTLDAYGNVDLTDEPVVLHVPVVSDSRWYIAQIGDMFDEVVANIGGVKGPGPGDCAIVGPDFRGQLPAEFTEIRLRTRTAIAAVRLYVANEDDAPAAITAQKGFRLIPLSAYLRDGLGYRPPAESRMVAVLEDHAPEDLRFFDHLGQAMRWYLQVSGDRDDSLIATFAAIGLTLTGGFRWDDLDESTRRGLARAAVIAEQIIDSRWRDLGEITNGWRYYFAGGRAGHDHALRAALVKNALGAQLATEVIYPPCDQDANGEPFDGARNYVLHFPSDQMPPVSQFWNLSLYGADMMFVDNDYGRYSIGNTTPGLITDPDGSITLHIRHLPPEGDERANWLPAPEGPFNLTMRFYGPSTAVLDGTYRLPPVAPTN